MTKVDVGALLSASVDLATRASWLIRAIIRSGADLRVVDKAAAASGAGNTATIGAGPAAAAEVDPTTIADVSAQALIEGSLRQIFGPELQLVGEEGAGAEGGRPELCCGPDVRTRMSVLHGLPPPLPPPLHAPQLSPLTPLPSLVHLSDGRAGGGAAGAGCAATAADIDASDDVAQLMVDLRDVVVFVDPLDGTKEFTQGLHDAVTVMVGITLRGRPLAGVLAQPWGGDATGAVAAAAALRGWSGGDGDNATAAYLCGSRCVWGAVGLGVFEGKWAPENAAQAAAAAAAADGSAAPEPCPAPVGGWQRLSAPHMPPVPARGHIVGTTRSHARPELERALARCGVETAAAAGGVGGGSGTGVVRVGGAGNKVLKLIDGEIDCWLYPCDGTKRWDTAAGEALLLELGGRLTDKMGAEYHYGYELDVESPALRNKEGVVATLGGSHAFYVDACAPAMNSTL